MSNADQQPRNPLSEGELRDLVREIVTEVVEQRTGTRKGEPPGAPTPRRPKRPTGPSSGRDRRQLVMSLALLVLFLSVVVVGLVGSFMAPRSATIPDELVGVWNTEASRYADRAFQISKAMLVFHTGDGGFTAHPITRVRTQEEDSGRTLYTVEYEADDAVYEFSFFYLPTTGAIRFRNQQQLVWTKGEGLPVPLPEGERR